MKFLKEIYALVQGKLDTRVMTIYNWFEKTSLLQNQPDFMH